MQKRAYSKMTEEDERVERCQYLHHRQTTLVEVKKILLQKSLPAEKIHPEVKLIFSLQNLREFLTNDKHDKLVIETLYVLQLL